MQDHRNPQNALFEIVDQVPSQVWYSLGILSILASLIFQLIGKKNWADFIGKWPPTFLLVGLYHKLLRPGSEDATGQLRDLAERVR
ncbi:hypothetical protein [Kallotenue papyrolyticum]|uniref:hypothetical protein n=1 Tax=Kallotenue papyrolyticum TaxID=1325125 RepID=UPI00047854C7|nr:hypothetical protein [Kallotenue papyrolyticum]